MWNRHTFYLNLSSNSLATNAAESCNTPTYSATTPTKATQLNSVHISGMKTLDVNNRFATNYGSKQTAHYSNLDPRALLFCGWPSLRSQEKRGSGVENAYYRSNKFVTISSIVLKLKRYRSIWK